MIKNFIFTIMASLMPVAAGYFYFKDVPDIRYLISDGIQVAGDDGAAGIKFAQQISVSNVGSAEAERVILKIPGVIDKYTINKHSASVLERAAINNGKYEIEYPLLPPGARYQVNIKYQGIPMPPSEFMVLHANGTGVDALNRESILVKLAFPAMYLLFVVLMVYLSARDILKSIRNDFVSPWGGKIADTLTLKRPWYVNADVWPEMLSKRVEVVLTRNSDWKGVELSNAAQLLAAERPDVINEHNWKSLCAAATDRYLELFRRDIITSRSLDSICDIAKLARPRGLPDKIWSDMQVMIVERCLDIVQAKYAAKQKVVVYIAGDFENSDCLPFAVKDAIKREAQKRLKELILDDMLRFPDKAIEVINSHEGKLLDPESRVGLEKYAYLAARGDSMKNLFFMDKLKDFVDRERPQWVMEYEFDYLKKLVDDILDAQRKSDEIVKKKYDIQKREDALECERIKLENDQGKVSAQLRFIHDLLLDPALIDRVEKHEILFAMGNFENLKKVAMLLSGASNKVQQSE